MMTRRGVGLLRRAAVVGMLAAASLVPAAANSAPPPLRVTSPTVEATGPDGADATYEVKAFDPTSGNPLTATCDPPSGASGSGDFFVTGHFPLGQTTVTCNTTTEDSTPVQQTGTVTVQDTTPPSVTAPANVSASTSDASASDVVDGSLPATCSPSSGSKFPVGTTTVTCSATDSHGNTGSASFSVTVTINDTTPPVVSVPGDFSVETESTGGGIVTFSASATDNVDGPLPVTCSPASGSTFPVGTTKVTCTATDSHQNTGSADFNVTVNLVDHTAPVITVPASFSVNTPNPSGTSVTYSASATDNLDGPVTPSCAPASGSTFPLGQTTVTCTATDTHGNTSQKSFTITVVLVDTTAPVITVPADISVTTPDPVGAAVTYTARASDNLDGPITPSCTPASGAVFPVG